MDSYAENEFEERLVDSMSLSQERRDEIVFSIG